VDSSLHNSAKSRGLFNFIFDLTRGYQLCILKEEGPPSGKLDDPDCGTGEVFRLMNGFNILPFAHRINHKKGDSDG